MENTNEIWLPVVGYTGLYEVSSLGRVRSLNYNREGRVHVLKPEMTKWGYLRVNLYKDGKHKHYSVHRLVAQAFLDNPLELTEVNHKDECKTNNCVDNLEWTTAKDNCNHGTRTARIAAAKSKPVEQRAKDGRLIAVWASTREAWRQTGISQGNICKCCNGHRYYHTAGGFVWKYVE